MGGGEGRDVGGGLGGGGDHPILMGISVIIEGVISSGDCGDYGRGDQ
jgi:hypothetical protein